MKRINISFLGNTSHITFAQHVLDSIKAVELFDLDKQEDSVIKLALEHFRGHIADVSQLKKAFASTRFAKTKGYSKP